jgi:DNA-binding NarL/FixJ family response regulator
MVAVALYAATPDDRRRLERLAATLPSVTLIGSAAAPVELARLLDQDSADVVLALPPTAGVPLAGWLAPARRATIVLLLEDAGDEAALDALYAGAQAVLPRDAPDAAVAAAIAAAARGFGTLPRALLDTLVDAREPDAPRAAGDEGLTPRELDVLAALADGASNKLIARRLGISFHTVKFHVASILDKLDADTRTEAVAQAARRGLVML